MYWHALSMALLVSVAPWVVLHNLAAACSFELVRCMASMSGCAADTSPLCRCWVLSTWMEGWTERAMCTCGAVRCRTPSASSCHGRRSRVRTVPRGKPRGRPRGKPASRPRQTLLRTRRGMWHMGCWIVQRISCLRWHSSRRRCPSVMLRVLARNICMLSVWILKHSQQLL